MNFRGIQVFTCEAIPQITIQGNLIPVSMIVMKITTPVLKLLDGSFPSARKTNLASMPKNPELPEISMFGDDAAKPCFSRAKAYKLTDHGAV